MSSIESQTFFFSFFINQIYTIDKNIKFYEIHNYGE